MTGFYAAPWVHQLPLDMRAKLASGQSVVVGGKVLVVCRECMSVIQVNKLFVGSLHLCQ
jgi:hypothetical protein